jgi:hypothetical protein
VYACNKFVAKQQTLQPAARIIYPKGRNSEEAYPTHLDNFHRNSGSIDGRLLHSLVHLDVNDRTDDFAT